MGQAAVDARLSPSADTCGGPDGAWRASEGNMKQLEFFQNVPLIVRGSPEMRKMVQDTLRNVREARAKGREFSGPIRCAPTPEKPADPNSPPSAMKGRLILLTDSLCFSSCLAVTDDFRSLGAFHVGQTTDAATHFVDVREQWLPSGYAMFSTLQSLDPDAPTQVGPYEPTLPYNGDIADTPTLETWVIGTAIPAAMK
jgi:hypothetical protein